MIFELEASCFQQTRKEIDLLELAHLVLKGRHRLYVREEAHTDYLSWLQTLSDGLSEIWHRSLSLSMELEALEPAVHTVKVCDVSQCDHVSSPPILNVEQASRLAKEPYRIFVENDDADRDFLLTFSDSHQKEKIEALEYHNLVRFEHCGGIGELKKKVSRFAHKGCLNHTICIAVFDSDAPQPDEISRDAIAVTEVCNANRIIPYMLRRRAIENYLLRSWLGTWVNKSRQRRTNYLSVYKNFCKLNSSQRAHFHMKKGLLADKTNISNGTIRLYGDVASDVVRAVEHGFGDDVGSELYSELWVQESHPIEDNEAWIEVNGIVRDFLVQCR